MSLGFKVEIQGLDELMDKATRLRKGALNNASRRAMRASLKPLRNDIRNATPRSGRERGSLRPLYKSWASKARVRLQPGYSPVLQGKVYARRKAPYKAFFAHLPEYGTRKQSAQKFMRGIFNYHKPQIEARFMRAWEKSLKEEWTKQAVKWVRAEQLQNFKGL